MSVETGEPVAVIEHAAEQLGVVPVEGRQVGVMDHVRVGGALDDGSQLRAGGERARLEAARDEPGQLLHACPVVRPDHVQRAWCGPG